MEESYLLEKKFQYLLDMATKKNQQELESLKTTITNLQNDINMLKRTKITETTNPATIQTSSQVSNISQPVYPQPSAAPKQEQMVFVQSKGADGGFSKEDVSINKFFYCGNKR